MVSSPVGFVDSGRLYTLSTFKRVLGITDATLRAARRNGLKVQYAHKLGYILGADWIAYVRSQKPKKAGSSSTLPSSHG